MMIDVRPLRGHIPARYHLAHLARDNPDCGTYKAGYRAARKILLIADITRPESAREDRYRARPSDTSDRPRR